MNLVKNKIQVLHFAQIPCKPFCVDVKDELEAKRIKDILANQHLFLFEQNIIPDYANIITVVMWDETLDDNNNPYGWIDYFNEEENMDWNEFEETYLI